MTLLSDNASSIHYVNFTPEGCLTWSQTVAQTGYQAHGQVMFGHLILGDANIIRNTVEPNYSGFTIIDSIAGSRVTIPGLADTTGVDNQSAFPQSEPDIR